jgi:hypothetical protein
MIEYPFRIQRQRFEVLFRGQSPRNTTSLNNNPATYKSPVSP